MAAAVTSLSLAQTASTSGIRPFQGLRRSEVETVTGVFRIPALALRAGQQQQQQPAFPSIQASKTLKRSKIILVKDLPSLGKAGDLVLVKKGYFRNYLLPYQFAKPATPTVLRQIKLAEDRRLAEVKKVKDEAEVAARQLKMIGQYIVRRKVGKGNAIFGTVTAQDVADIVTAKSNRVVDKKDVEVPEIKEIGFFDATIKLHPEVSVTLKINVTKA